MDDKNRHQTGHFFLALDPVAFRDEGGFEDEPDGMMDHLRGLTPSNPEFPVLAPGDPEDAAFAERGKQGVPMPGMLLKAVADVYRGANVEFQLRETA